jgi:hypothetical protein
MKREMLVLTWAAGDPAHRPSSEQDRELSAWFDAEGVPHEKVYALRFDTAVRNVTVYRFAYRTFPEIGATPCVFKGYLMPDGRAVLDPEYGGEHDAAKEWPTTHAYTTDPPAWLADVAYRVERDDT